MNELTETLNKIHLMPRHDGKVFDWLEDELTQVIQKNHDDCFAYFSIKGQTWTVFLLTPESEGAKVANWVASECELPLIDTVTAEPYDDNGEPKEIVIFEVI